MDQGGPSQSRRSTQPSRLRRSMNFTCNIHKLQNMAASHRRRRHPSLKISRDRFITRKRRLGRLWTLDPLPRPSERQHNNARLPHSSEVFCSGGLCSPLPQGSLPPSSRWWWRDTVMCSNLCCTHIFRNGSVSLGVCWNVSSLDCAHSQLRSRGPNLENSLFGTCFDFSVGVTRAPLAILWALHRAAHEVTTW